MPKPDATDDVRLRAQGCDECGWDSPVKPFDPEHDVHHIKTEHRMRAARGDLPITAADWRKYALALEQLNLWRQGHRKGELDVLNSKIVDLELEVGAYKYDLKVLAELVDDLKADLAAVEEGRH